MSKLRKYISLYDSNIVFITTQNSFRWDSLLWGNRSNSFRLLVSVPSSGALFKICLLPNCFGSRKFWITILISIMSMSLVSVNVNRLQAKKIFYIFVRSLRSKHYYFIPTARGFSPVSRFLMQESQVDYLSELPDRFLSGFTQLPRKNILAKENILITQANEWFSQYDIWGVFISSVLCLEISNKWRILFLYCIHFAWRFPVNW